jgi:tRNA (guanine37-N1)-methyltransferase
MMHNIYSYMFYLEYYKMTRKKAQAVRVPLEEAEQVRRYLQTHHLLRKDMKPLKENTHISFPIKPDWKTLPFATIVTKSFEPRIQKPHSYKDLLSLSKKQMSDLPTSYDIIGKLILIKLPDTLLKYQNQIGAALLQAHKNIKTVCLAAPVAGELRTRKITVIAGKKKTLTTHREYGLLFYVDVATTYFSPRLASERKRIASLVRPKETIVDLFAGVAPFSIMIARYANPKIVYAIDKNKKAINLAQRNIKQNHVLDRVEPIHADAKNIKKIISVPVNRIIMNLPFSAYMFLSAALSIAAEKCILHYYDILREEEKEERISLLKNTAEKHGYHLTITSMHTLKSYAPREFYIGLDITATKHADVA